MSERCGECLGEGVVWDDWNGRWRDCMNCGGEGRIDPYEQDEWHESEEERHEREAAEFASRPIRFFYHFNDRVHADIGADDEISEAWLDYLRYWARTGYLQSWKAVRAADGVTLANWERSNA